MLCIKYILLQVNMTGHQMQCYLWTFHRQVYIMKWIVVLRFSSQQPHHQHNCKVTLFCENEDAAKKQKRLYTASENKIITFSEQKRCSVLEMKSISIVAAEMCSTKKMYLYNVCFDHGIVVASIIDCWHWQIGIGIIGIPTYQFQFCKYRYQNAKSRRRGQKVVFIVAGGVDELIIVSCWIFNFTSFNDPLRTTFNDANANGKAVCSTET